MNWWQEVLQMMTILGWWRIIVIFIATILVGILASTGMVYLISRFVLKDHIRYSEVFSLLSIRIKKPAINLSRMVRQERTSPPTFPVVRPFNNIGNIIPQQNNTIANLYSDLSDPGYIIPSDTLPLAPKPEIESNSLEKDLIVELDHNLRIINEFNGIKLSPLQNRAWLAHIFSNKKFSIDLEHELEQLYLDISVWNNMLWVSTELSHQTDFSNKRYQESLFNIAERLKKIRRVIK